MKFPVVAIAICFTSGIAVGFYFGELVGSLVLRGVPASRGTGEFNAAADATGSTAQPAAINNRAPPGIHDSSYIARVKTVRHLRLALSSQ